MLVIVAVTCGILLGLAAGDRAVALYWRCLAACPLGHGRASRLLLGAQRRLLARTGHHPYLVGCLEALERAADAPAVAAAQARLRWWCAVHGGRDA